MILLQGSKGKLFRTSNTTLRNSGLLSSQGRESTGDLQGQEELFWMESIASSLKGGVGNRDTERGNLVGKLLQMARPVVPRV